MVGDRKLYKVLVGKPEGKRQIGRPRRSWEDEVKKNLRKIGWEGVEWIHLAQDTDWRRALVNTVMNPQILAPES
jgi:hypothetical protein